MKYYKITAKHAGLRLDKFLVEKLGLSRNQIQKSIKKEEILVNKAMARVHEFLSVGDIISFRNPKSQTLNPKQIPNAKSQTQNPQPATRNPQPSIILENPEFLVIEKPAGLLVHEKGTVKHPTLVDWLVEKYPEIAKVHDPVSLQREDFTYRPGIVHRLDRDVSGLMIVARTQDAFDHFKRLFKAKKIQKEYLALVVGRMKEDLKTAEFPIGRATSGRFVALPMNSLDGKSAKTEIEKIKFAGGYTLVRAIPFTGRTNQIRAHLSALGYPIVGDFHYMSPKLLLKQKINPGRIFLHAAKLTFESPDGEMMSIESELPAELQAIIKKLK